MQPEQIEQAVSTAWYVGIVKLAVFSICVTAVVEAVKHFVGSVVKSETYKKFFTPDRLRFITFGVALYIAQAFDYGVLRSVIEGGKAYKEAQAMWSDFLVTASLCMMGARWAFSQYSTILANLQAKKDKALNGNKA